MIIRSGRLISGLFFYIAVGFSQRQFFFNIWFLFRNLDKVLNRKISHS